MAILAVQTICGMRGGAQSQLILGADDSLWVVKFQNNPQGKRILANEMIATRLAAAVGLTVPQTDIIDVPETLIKASPHLWVTGENGMPVRCEPGLQFGSRFVGGLMPGQVVDVLPEAMLSDLTNLQEFAGMLCIDKWTGNSDKRQAVYSRKPRKRCYEAIFIDQGFCFGGKSWDFHDAPLSGAHVHKKVYEKVTGWESFEPWLGRLEALEAETLKGIAQGIPAEWYGHDESALRDLIELLLVRRSRVREWISAFRDSDREPFPNWKALPRTGMPDLDASEAAAPLLSKTCLA